MTENIKAIFGKATYPPAWRHYINWLMYGFESLGVLEVQDVPGMNIITCVCPIDIIIDGKTTRVWYDFNDFGERFHPAIIRPGDLYFKVECQEQHLKYGMRSIGHLAGLPKEFLPLQAELKTETEYARDVFFNGRITSGDRIAASAIIAADTGIDSMLMLQPFHGRLAPPAHLAGAVLEYRKFLTEIKRSRINLMLPGLGELTLRITPTLGLGACGLMPKLKTIMPSDHAGCWIEVERDYSDLLDKIHYYLDHENERLEIAANGLRYYEEWLSPESQARHIIRAVKEMEANDEQV